jgi:hypothetical protein
MTDETLSQLLGRVHERLSTLGPLDPQAREMLATVMRDIDNVLEKQGTAHTAETGPVSSVRVSPDARVAATASRLEEVAVRFEAEHPAIAELLRQIGALLGQAGI